jgi:hypothetical protein
LPFQRTISSTLILGAGKDAGYIANHIASKRAAKEVKYRTSMQGSRGEQTSKQL